MKKKQLVLIIASVMILAGCWDKKELSNITVVTGMAIDKGDKEKYKLTIEGINARELNSKTQTGVAPSIVYSQEGGSVAELSKKMNIGLARHLIYSHMRVLVVSEDIAREGMMEFVDYLERNREIRDDFNFLVAKKGKAADVLRVSYSFTKSSSMKLFTQLRTMSKEWGGDPDVRMNDVINAWTSPGRQPVMQAVTIIGDKEKGNSAGNMNKLSPDALVIASSLAVFKGEKLKGFLPVNKTRDYLWTQDDLQQTSVSFPCKNDKNVTIRLYNNTTKMKTDLVNGKARLKIGINAIGYLEGIGCPFDLTDVNVYKKLEAVSARQIEKDITATIKNTQKKYKSDIFGFGEALYRQHPKKFKNVEKHWDEAFSEGDVEVNVRISLRRSGIRTKSFLQNLK